MTDHQQPEALSLADWLDAVGNGSISTTAAAAELRRLHAESIEQARLLGMSAERELALRARVQELDKARQRAADAIRAGAKEPSDG